MTQFSRNIVSQIKTPVGDGKKSDPLDVIATRRHFSRLGYHDADTERGYIDRDLDRSIRRFQKDNDLRHDGFMNPGGETERALNAALQHVSSDGIEREELKPVERYIPGTNIPDRGVPEGGWPGSSRYDRYRTHDGFQLNMPYRDFEPPNRDIDPMMEANRRPSGKREISWHRFR